ncbi:MAG TPA: DUF3108 domain-containing protein [Sunxiuqinia sp.]|nr:DUF3108 domain-containing protein [Sunxiuqinia sp.]
MLRNPSPGVKGIGLLIIAALLLLSVKLKAKGDEHVFQPGEKLTYGAYYNWHFIWVNAGEVVFKADTIRHNNTLEWLFDSDGKTYKAYDLFYSIRDTFQSRVTYHGFLPDYFVRRVNHAHNPTIHEYHFHRNTGTIYSYIKREDEIAFHDTIPFKTGTSDMLGTVYAFRDYDYDKLYKDQQVNFTMLVDNKTEDLYFRYLGKEKVKTRNGRTFMCHEVLIRLLGGDFFPDGEYMRVWFTADRNHIPVRVETEILVGSVNAILTDLEHVKYPLTSEIK